LIEPSSPTTSNDVARFYDDNDFFYRRICGEHLHHGLWNDREDKSTVEQATDRLLYLTTRPLRLLPGQSVADIGCGYGASSTWLAESFGTEVLGLNLSGIQTNVARSRPTTRRGRVRIVLRDWLDNHLEPASLDAAIAIEALAHMPDKARFFEELRRTLKPGGKAGIACWTADPEASPFESWLLRRICTQGKLAGIGSIGQYRSLATGAGLEILDDQDVTKQVERTWKIIARRTLAELFTSGKFLRFTARRLLHAPLSAFTLPQLLLGYQNGALRYHLLWVRKPVKEHPPESAPDAESVPVPVPVPVPEALEATSEPESDTFEMPPLEPFKPPTKRSGDHRGIGALVSPAPLQADPSVSRPSANEPD
jgi:tocopherol O-methyltransferase